MRVMINGQEMEVPTEGRGTIRSDVVRRAGAVPSNRALILKRKDGSNTVVNPYETMDIQPGDHFEDMPLHERGGSR